MYIDGELQIMRKDNGSMFVLLKEGRVQPFHTHWTELTPWPERGPCHLCRFLELGNQSNRHCEMGFSKELIFYSKKYWKSGGGNQRVGVLIDPTVDI
ncbi:hypothetical protein ACFX14_035833 [Malus domestica]